MNRSFFFFIFLMIATCNANAQLAKTDSLFLALKNQDSVFFERSFNLCDLDYLDKTTHPELIFFHDQGGIQHKPEFMASVKSNICGNADQKPIRKVMENSLEVFPLYQNGHLYGVIQIGIHDFYIREKGKSDRHTSRAKFTHVWLLDNGRWLLREVLSYDHK
jgi:Domain of unknown function (DUF4440)